MGVKACWDSVDRLKAEKPYHLNRIKEEKVSANWIENLAKLSDYIAQVHCTKKGHKRKG